MNLSVDNPWLLGALLLCLLPVVNNGIRQSAYPSLALLPYDPLSTLVAWGLRLSAIAAIAALVLGLAGLNQREQSLERIGHGANIALLLDRSNSMDNSFAGKTPDGDSVSKAAAARRLLNEFIDRRPHDRIAIAEYSTAPLWVLPLTDNKAALKAAIDATATPALAYTHISKGLSMALDFFASPDGAADGSRIVLLVSDGAAAIDPDSEPALRKAFKERQVRLYWLYLRSVGSPGLFEQPQDPRDDNAQALPERHLHLFFQSLNIPYQAYQAENPVAMRKAIDDISRLEHAPLHYLERIPKKDLSTACYQWATLLLAVLLAAKCCEERLDRNPAGF